MSETYTTKSLIIAACLRMHGCEPLGYERDEPTPGREAELAFIFEKTPIVEFVLSQLRTDELRVSPFTFANVFGGLRTSLLAAKYGEVA